MASTTYVDEAALVSVKSIPEAIDTLGFGLYQVTVIVLCAGFIVSEGSQLNAASALIERLSADFGVTTVSGKSMLMSIVFIGFACGSIAGGQIGDYYGRRMPLLIGYVGILGCALGASLIQGAAALFVIRFFEGVFSGIGLVNGYVAISEVCPRNARGATYGSLCIAFILGEIWSAWGLCNIMNDLRTGPWRLMFLWVAAPIIAMLTLGLVTRATRHDTPFWLAANGKHKDLQALMDTVADMNGCARLKTAESCCSPGTSSSLITLSEVLARWPSNLYVALGCFMFFTKDFFLYGMTVFWPIAWARLQSRSLGLSPAENMLLTASCGVPGVAIAMFACHKLGRKPILCCVPALCGAACLLVDHLDQPGALGAVGALSYKALFPTFQATVYVLPNELFPTPVRGAVFSVLACFGRVASVIVPFLVEGSRHNFLMVCAGLGLGFSVAAAAFPETKDCELQVGLNEMMPKMVDYGTMTLVQSDSKGA